ncbi:unnamed protein product [Eruca vesicaria subsp. sativa]|uniref:Uncharacterized protein n=1 Tax=Eruca vesicaria subsp. sativa TaxID=29727 RepID=A0ABC8IVR2_ERUVS|nr:unnamed protein product [Eruca vesicaria subsp. sativa]
MLTCFQTSVSIRPTVKSSPDAPKLAQERLNKMGPMSKNELIMAATLFPTVGLWVFGAKLSVDAVTAAILGLSVLLVTGVVTWKECLAESVAWFAALIVCLGILTNTVSLSSLWGDWVCHGNYLLHVEV